MSYSHFTSLKVSSNIFIPLTYHKFACKGRIVGEVCGINVQPVTWLLVTHGTDPLNYTHNWWLVVSVHGAQRAQVA